MNKEQQRIAIAELCGWTSCKMVDNDPMGRPPNTTSMFEIVPDYLNDLNAMAQAEKILDDEIMDAGSKRYVYAGFLYSICGKEQQPCRATSAQRAEAFLRTMGKWVK